MSSKYWTYSRGYFTVSAADMIGGCTFGKCECSKITLFDVELIVN